MQGIYYLLSLICLGMILRWFILNDGKADGSTTGLFRIADHSPLPTANAPFPGPTPDADDQLTRTASRSTTS